MANAVWSKSKRWAAPLRAVFGPRFHSPLPAKEEWAWDRDWLEFGRARLWRFLVATRIYLGSHWFIKLITILLLAIVVALIKASSSQGTDCELQKWPCYRVNYLWASTTSFFIFFFSHIAHLLSSWIQNATRPAIAPGWVMILFVEDRWPTSPPVMRAVIKTKIKMRYDHLDHLPSQKSNICWRLTT